ncbi:hypothetical protein IV500_08445 [Paeniglutamicibacter antarcticus]|uniref:lysozyme n=1 Tax=Arthrobacter terrae TaxID=2935737 RepID=A0A931CNX4_9MICC|nr:GH25 family lysozyme [Arthrobacter terrae]MBG0739416.1 hypothetical protein [Arthrobacter terrae]
MPMGIDVSGWQGNVNWAAQRNNGVRFAYVKASEGTSAMNDYFGQQYNGAAAVGILRGAYHYARPDLSSGASEARTFANSGGGWAADGRTLPGVLDLEAGTPRTSGTCYGKTPGQLTAWTRDFTSTYKALTGRDAVIYTGYYFWQDCLGGTASFSGTNPLWIAAYGAAANNVYIPGGWPQYTFWQYTSDGGDQNVFNGSYSQLQAFAATAGSEPGTLLVKGTSDPTIYMLSGSSKYAIPDWATFLRYQGVSALLTLDDGYLARLTTGPAVGRFVRSPDGTISLLNGGALNRVPNCSMMNDFGGGNCTNWVPLSNTQLARFSKGPELANAVLLPGSRNLFVKGGATREYFDVSALTQAGLPTRQISLPEDMFTSVPRGTPIMRADSIAIDRETGTPYLYTLGQLHALPVSVNKENVWTRSLAVYHMDAVSLGKLKKTGPYTGWAANASGSKAYLVGSEKKFQLTSAPNWGVSVTTMSDGLLALIANGSRISLPALISIDTSANIYALDGGKFRQISDWATLTNLFGPTLPPIVDLPPMVTNSLAPAAPILPTGKLYVAPTSPMVYLSDGTGSMVPLPNFSIASRLGINGYTHVSTASLAPYRISNQVLTPVLNCNGGKYLQRNGKFVRLSTSVSSTGLLPSTALARSTCQALGVPASGFTTVSRPVFVMDDASSTVYSLQGKTKRPVGNWARLVSLNGGRTDPIIAVYDVATLASLPSGKAA